MAVKAAPIREELVDAVADGLREHGGVAVPETLTKDEVHAVYERATAQDPAAPEQRRSDKPERKIREVTTWR